jgi:hypothetical protein
MKTTTLIILFTFLIASVVQSQELEYSFKENFDVSPPTNLKISSSNSNIEVLSHNINTIEIQYLVKKNGKLLLINKDTFNEIIKNQSNLNVHNSENGLDIEVTNTAKKGYIKSEDAVIIDFKVFVPKDTNCELISSDGNITLNGLNSNQKCITSDGNIKLSDLDGDVIAKTSDGDIIISNVIGKVDSETNDGEIIKMDNWNE